MWHFNPNKASTWQTVCWDNLLLWHLSTYTIRPRIFRPPRLQGGRFVTCDITSTFPKMLSDIMSTLSWGKICMVCHKIFGATCDVLQAVWRHVDVLSQDFFQYICDVQPAFHQNVDVLLHDFWTFVMSCHLLSEMWMFCHMIFTTRLRYPAGFSAQCGRFVTQLHVLTELCF